MKCDRELPCYQCTRGLRTCEYANFVNTNYDSDASELESPERLAKRSRYAMGLVGDGRNGRPASQGESLATLPANSSGLANVSARLERLERIVLGNSRLAHTHGAPATPQTYHSHHDSDGLPCRDQTFHTLVGL